MSTAERRARTEIRKAHLGNRMNTNERVQEQAEVTMHIYPSMDLSSRSDNALNNKPKDTIYPYGSELMLHEFEEGDLVWDFRRDSAGIGSSTGFLRGSNSRGFISLNGMDVAAFGTAERLQNSMVRVCVSKAVFNPLAADGTATTGVAGTTYGSKSITNVVVKQAYTGDRLIAFCPNIRLPNELEAFSHGGLGLSPQKRHKLTPVLKPFDIKNVKLNERILTSKAMGMNRAIADLSFSDVIQENIHFTPEEEAAARLQHFYMWAVYVLWAELNDRGLIRFHLKPKGDGLDGRGWEFDFNTVGNGQYDAIDLLNGQTPATTTNYEDIKFQNDSLTRYGTLMDDDTCFERREAEALWMASLLGLVEGGALAPADTKEVQNDILKMIAAGQTLEPLYYPMLGGLFDEDSEFDVETLFGLDDLPNLIHHLVKNRLDIQHNLHQGSVYLNKVTAGKISATSLGGAVAGDQIVDIETGATNWKYK